jgi:hypothetical protein
MAQPAELLLSVSGDCEISNPGWLVKVPVPMTRENADADWMLDTGKDPRIDGWLVTFRRQVNDPSVIGLSPKILPHPRESRTRGVGRGTYVRNDSLWVITV